MSKKTVTIGNVGVYQNFEGKVENNQVIYTKGEAASVSNPTQNSGVKYTELEDALYKLKEHIQGAQFKEELNPEDLTLLDETINSVREKDDKSFKEKIEKFGTWLLLRVQEVGIGLTIEAAKQQLLS